MDSTHVGEAGEEPGDIRTGLQRAARLSGIGRGLGLRLSDAAGRGALTLELSSGASMAIEKCS